MNKHNWVKEFKSFVISWIITIIVRIWFKTLKVKILNNEIYDKYAIDNINKFNVISGCWHRNILFIFYHFKYLKSRVVTMISKSNDGDIAAGAAKNFKYRTVRGSSKKGGRDAIWGVIHFFKEKKGRYLATAVDGPQGPNRILKKGVLVVAKETGAAVIPITWSGKHLITFRKSWDKMILPVPFSTIILAVDKPIYVPHDISDENFEKLRDKAEKIINNLTDNIDRLCKYE